MAGSLLQIEDLGNGQIRVAYQRGTMLPRSYPTPLPFSDPLTDKDRADLRWYLEEFLTFPYGAEPDKAARIEQRMEEWGTNLFRTVFPRLDASPDPRALYEAAITPDIGQCELAIVSDDPAFLNIPWELLHDPTPGRQYLAPLLGGLFRQRRGHALTAPPAIDPSQPFRILLVVSRPYGNLDVPLGTVARPLLEALRDRWPQIEVELLRPPTFDALQRRLNERPGYYGLVHFDGHGVFAEDRTANLAGPIVQYGARVGAGRLVFETRDGQPYPVPSADLGQALAACKVPLFVLNACQSAEIGRNDPFSSVAAQLVAIGATGVVAMAYSVYASAAGTFVGRLYERLVAGSTLAGAVADGRRALFADSSRDSIVGPLPLRDWLVPTVYQQVTSFQPVAAIGAESSVQVSDEVVALRRRIQEVTRPPGRFGFIGRDYDLLRIERALNDPQRPWALLSGVGGTGKTALAYGFARWYHETGGCPGGVFVTSFKSSVSFAQVVGSIAGYGTDLSRFPPDQQRHILTDHLRQTPCLLIWDNVEGVTGYPEGTSPLATEGEQAELGTFLQDLRGGQTRVLVTTRKQEESWLGVAYSLIETAGLTDRDAIRLAEAILGTVGKQPSDFRKDHQYADLLKLLRGHPRSLEIVLPLLRRRTPGQILDALQHQTVTDDASLLDASHAYVFGNLSERARRHLPLVGVFTGIINVGVIDGFIAVGGGSQQAVEEIIGESLSPADWRNVLSEAAGAALLREISQGVYELHPTLPSFLRRCLTETVNSDEISRINAELSLYYAWLSEQLLSSATAGNSDTFRLLHSEEPNILRSLRISLQEERWNLSLAILHIVAQTYEIEGRDDDLVQLCNSVLARTGVPDKNSGEHVSLWANTLGDLARLHYRRGDFSRAKDILEQLLQYFESLDADEAQSAIATTYHELGRIALEQRELNEAEHLERHALDIRRRLRQDNQAAATMQVLGSISHATLDYSKAEYRYLKALRTFETSGLQRDAAAPLCL